VVQTLEDERVPSARSHFGSASWKEGKSGTQRAQGYPEWREDGGSGTGRIGRLAREAAFPVTVRFRDEETRETTQQRRQRRWREKTKEAKSLDEEWERGRE